MNVLSNMLSRLTRGGAKNKVSRRADRVYDRGADGEPLYADNIVAFVKGELERRREERRPFEVQWTLNANFLSGNQHCGINPYNLEIEDYAAPRDYMEHGVFNRIAPLIETRLANLKTVSFAMTVNPRTSELDDYEKSDISTKLLRYTQSATDFESKKNQLLLWSELCGSAFVLSWWDGNGGEMISHGDSGDVCEGALDYGIITPFEVFPDSVCAQSIADQRSILICQIRSADEVSDLYGIRVEGCENETYSLAPAAAENSYGEAGSAFTLNTRRVKDSVCVLTYFERPSGAHPGGRLIITAGDTLVWYSELPYDDIPMVMLRCKESPGRFFGRSVIEELIPLQRAYNGTKNKIHDYIRASAANPLLVPEGSVADIESFATRGLPPGEIVEYDPERGKPEPLATGSLPAEVRIECATLASDMEYVAGVSSLMVYGSTPSGVTSGTAIEKLRSIDNTRLSLSGENLRTCVKALAVQWLGIYKKCVSGYRTLEISGMNDMGGVLTWCADDINSFDVTFDAENELLMSKEAQKETFMSALSLGLLNDDNGKLPLETRRRALEMMQVGRYTDLMGEDELQTQRARREQSLLLRGEIPSVGAFDDHEIHVSEHRKFALQMKYESLRRRSPELCSEFDRHIAEHIMKMQTGVVTGEKAT